MDLDLTPWSLDTATIAPLPGGYNSITWDVRTPDHHFVAKRVAGERGQFEAGLRIQAILTERGHPAGAPVPTADGALCVPHGDGWLALLEFVPGETTHELRTWGRAMGRAHRLLVDVPWPGPPATSAAAPSDDGFLQVAPWVGPALAEVNAEVGRTAPHLTHGIVHNDGCEARWDEASRTLSVIDWGAAAYGPLVGDIGAARWQFQSYGGGSADDFAPFLDGYLEEGPIDPAELAHVATFVRHRAALSGWYFAWRIHQNVTTGADDNWSQAGLKQARHFWETLATMETGGNDA